MFANLFSFNKVFTFLVYTIIFGITLVFSTYTRSVFEVNKLGITKIAICLMIIMFVYDSLFNKSKYFFKPAVNKLFNISLLVVWFSNILSTIFSKNITVSIFGSYDRWEGIITVTFYLILTYLIANFKNAKFAINLLWAIIIACGLSSLYGIIQSFGLDIVSWSIDPGKRVFGSINNPVHYCAIMGMSIPTIIGLMFYSMNSMERLTKKNYMQILLIILYYVGFSIVHILSPNSKSIQTIIIYLIALGAPYIIFGINFIRNNSKHNIFNILFTSLLLTIYATFSSFSRATWVSLMAVLGVFFYLNKVIKLNVSKNLLFVLILNSILLTMCIYLIINFQIYRSMPTSLSFLIMIIASLLLINSTIIEKNNENVIANILIQFTIFLLFFFKASLITNIALITIIFIAHFLKKKSFTFNSTQLLMYILIFSNAMHTGINIYYFIFNALSIFLISILDQKNSILKPFTNDKVTNWKLVIIAIFILLFNFNQFGKLLNLNSSVNIINDKGYLNRINAIHNAANKENARMSMWKSSIPWIKENPIIGTGLDTIKYMYPKYRRSEYGKLEGGHNYTPDRLHNEYLNTLATKGIIGFISFYIIFVGMAFLSAIYSFQKQTNNPTQYIILGSICSAMVYLGQVLFNFGVVATLVFFFIYMGILTSIKVNNETS